MDRLKYLAGRTIDALFCVACDMFEIARMGNCIEGRCPRCGSQREPCSILVRKETQLLNVKAK